MDDQKRGDDAEGHAPRPLKDEQSKPRPGKQDAPDNQDGTEGGCAIETEDVNAANDE